MSTPVAPSPPSVDLHWEILQRVASSASFQRSPRLRELLLYICERSFQNRTDDLREQAIGCAVFGRKPDYNPGEDNIVRVEVRQLRKRLDDYFAHEGKDEPYLIQIPKGAYVPVFELRDETAKESTAPVLPDSKPVAGSMFRSPWFWCQGAAIILLLAVCFMLWKSNRAAERRFADTVRRTPQRTALWPLLFNENQETFIVCADSTLVVAEWMMHRSISLDEYLARESGSLNSNPTDIKSLADSLAYNRQRWQFTDITDARLVQKLYRLNADNWDKVSVHSARNTKIQDFKTGNSVLLGSRRSNLWNLLFEPMMNFHFDYDEQSRKALVRNLKPQQDEQSLYVSARPGESGESYSVIALVPNLRHSGNVLMIAGTTAESTEAAGEFIMNSDSSAPLLNDLMRRNGNHVPYFEVLLRSRTLSGIAKNAEIIADRILPDEMPRN